MQKTTNDLSEFSASYYEKADVYKVFSSAEDREGYIWQSLKDTFTNKSVLDLGCGNGRYLELIEQVASHCVGIDQSLPQISQGKSHLPFLVADASKIPFENNSFDTVVSCWVWGTIIDEEKRLKVLEEAKRVTKSGGSIFLVENDTPSEFEYYRGRHLNTKTQDYNDWITSHGFTVFKKLETFITFENKDIATEVFEEIWKGRLFDTPKSHIIQNNVIIFELKID